MTDIWFSHERPLYLAVYGLSLAFSGKFAPVFAAFINTGQGWKWTLWWCAIGMGVAFVYCFFLMEETNYDRALQTSAPSAGASSDSIPGVQSANSEKPSIEKNANVTTDSSNIEAGQIMYPRKTYWQKLSVIDKKRPNRVLSIMWAPFKFFSMPVVVWAGFIYGTNALVWPGILNATASPLYTKVYKFNSNEVGYAYFGAVVGMVLGSVLFNFT